MRREAHPLIQFVVIGAAAWALIAYTIHPANDIAAVCEALHSTPAFPRATMNQHYVDRVKPPTEDERQPDHAVFVPTLEEAWPDFVDAVISVESSGNPNAENPNTGARGLMQIMEPTWKDQTNADWSRAFDPELNRTVGSAYLRWCRDYVTRKAGRKATAVDILCCYHGGVGNYKAAGWSYDGMGPQTQEYVGKVLAELDRRLYGSEVRR